MIWVKNPGGWGVYCQCVCVDDGLKKGAIALSWPSCRLKSASQIAPSQAPDHGSCKDMLNPYSQNEYSEI
jgi:hypothetical protein